MMGEGPIESVTTARQDFSPKCTERPELILPCGNIRTSKCPLERSTTMNRSYPKPKATEPVLSFKPQLKYYPPTEPAPTDTTQKLSYPPFRLSKKESYPWAQKSVYRFHPKLFIFYNYICRNNTYNITSKSYLQYLRSMQTSERNDGRENYIHQQFP